MLSGRWSGSEHCPAETQASYSETLVRSRIIQKPATFARTPRFPRAFSHADRGSQPNVKAPPGIQTHRSSGTGEAGLGGGREGAFGPAETLSGMKLSVRMMMNAFRIDDSSAIFTGFINGTGRIIPP